MISMGFPINRMYPNNGIFLEIAGQGLLQFKGSTLWGNDSAISVGPKGVLEIGNNVLARVSVRCCAYHYVSIGSNTTFAWNILIMDTSFHTMKDAVTHEKVKSKPFSPIIIGNSNFIGSNTTILKGTITPDNTIIAAGTIISKDLHVPKNCVIGGSPVRIIKEGIYFDMDDSGVEYEWYEKKDLGSF